MSIILPQLQLMRSRRVVVTSIVATVILILGGHHALVRQDPSESPHVTLSSKPPITGSPNTTTNNADALSRSTPIQGPPQYRIEETLGAALAPILSSGLGPSDKATALISSLRDSGAPRPDFSSTGGRIATLLIAQHVVNDWDCFAAGCYFKISSSEDMETLHAVIRTARSSVDANNILILTSDQFPNRLALIIPNLKSGGV